MSTQTVQQYKNCFAPFMPLNTSAIKRLLQSAVTAEERANMAQAMKELGVPLVHFMTQEEQARAFNLYYGLNEPEQVL
jgi:hypothetical protein